MGKINNIRRTERFLRIYNKINKTTGKTYMSVVIVTIDVKNFQVIVKL